MIVKVVQAMQNSLFKPAAAVVRRWKDHGSGLCDRRCRSRRPADEGTRTVAAGNVGRSATQALSREMTLRIGDRANHAMVSLSNRDQSAGQRPTSRTKQLTLQRSATA